RLTESLDEQRWEHWAAARTVPTARRTHLGTLPQRRRLQLPARRAPGGAGHDRSAGADGGGTGDGADDRAGPATGRRTDRRPARGQDRTRGGEGRKAGP